MVMLMLTFMVLMCSYSNFTTTREVLKTIHYCPTSSVLHSPLLNCLDYNSIIQDQRFAIIQSCLFRVPSVCHKWVRLSGICLSPTHLFLPLIIFPYKLQQTANFYSFLLLHNIQLCVFIQRFGLSPDTGHLDCFLSIVFMLQWTQICINIYVLIFIFWGLYAKK